MFSNYKLLENNDTLETWPVLAPGAWLAGLIEGITCTKHCYTLNIKAPCLMVSENIFVLCFPIVSQWELSVAMETRVLI